MISKGSAEDINESPTKLSRKRHKMKAKKAIKNSHLSKHKKAQREDIGNGKKALTVSG